MKYRKRPVVIEAVKFDGVEMVDDTQVPMFDGSFDALPVWLDDALSTNPKYERSAHLNDAGKIEIVTLEGRVEASVGDYIIRGVQGELYPCKPDIFAATYEAGE